MKIDCLLRYLRPFYRPIMSRVRKRLVTEHSFLRYPEMEIPRPWDYVQFKVERDLHSYLHIAPHDIKNIVVVGANVGNEVEDLGRTYKSANFVLFEPSPRYTPELLRRHANKGNVQCITKACGKESGHVTFYELPMHGNGSFLKPAKTWKDFNKQADDSVKEYTVEVTTLDKECHRLDQVDLLWVDVQGAEMHVLGGAENTLQKTKAVFLEVALTKSPYEGGALLHELDGLLQASGHQLTLLGLDPWNYTGNALWIQHPSERALK
jgi:FkbM family methyltransferase